MRSLPAWPKPLGIAPNRQAGEALAAALTLDTRIGEWKWTAPKDAEISREVHPLVFLLVITSFSLPGNVATQLPSFVSRITEVRNLSVPSGL